VVGGRAGSGGHGSGTIGNPTSISGDIEISVGTGMEDSVAKIGHATDFENTAILTPSQQEALRHSSADWVYDLLERHRDQWRTLRSL